MKEKKRHIMVVDDDIEYADNLANLLKELGQIEVVYSAGGFFSKFSPFSFDLVLLDLRLKKEKEGLEILKHIKEEDPGVVVIVISAYGDIATAVEALHMGSKTFLEKDKNSPKEIALISEHTLKEIELRKQLRNLTEKEEFSEIIGEDFKILQIKKLALFAAQDAKTSVFLRGETGVGKHHIARMIHNKGERKDGPFIVFSPLGLQEEDVQKTLFSKEEPGVIYNAHKGILVITDIAYLPLKIQAKLFEILDMDKRPDFQLLAITEKPIEKMLEEGKLDKRLFYHLKTFEINIPPLRERKGDISLLVNYFIERLRKKMKINSISSDALEAIKRYPFPGNVEELKTSMEAGALKAHIEGTDIITTRHIPIPIAEEKSSFYVRGEVRDIQKFLAEIELYLVEQTLKEVNWKKKDTVEKLGYSNRFSMLKRIKRHFERYPELKIRFRNMAAAYKIL